MKRSSSFNFLYEDRKNSPSRVNFSQEMARRSGQFRLKIAVNYGMVPEGILPEKLGGVCGPLPETLTLFQTKILGRGFSLPYFRSDQKFDALFQT